MSISANYKTTSSLLFFNLALITTWFLFPMSVMAATHEVMVLDPRSFSPNDLTIEVGDTVRWINADGGNTHDVTADDFSFNSVTAPGFTFEMTFNSVAEILYHCSVHSSPASSGGTLQNGRINVVAADTPPEFIINAGLNDAWFNPVTDGQGFFITVFPELGFVSLAWFTYDTELPPVDATANLGDPGHRWLTALGEIDGDQSEMGISITSGGLFDTPPDETLPRIEDGTIVLKFNNCNEGTVSYEIPSINAMGEVPIQRIANDNVVLCNALLMESQLGQ